MQQIESRFVYGKLLWITLYRHSKYVHARLTGTLSGFLIKAVKSTIYTSTALDECIGLHYQFYKDIDINSLYLGKWNS